MLPTSYLITSPFLTAATAPQEPPPADTPSGATPIAPAGGAPAGGAPGAGTVQDPNAPPTKAPTGAFGGDLFLYMMIFVAFMLFWSMRRDSKSRKAQQAMQSSIKQGDKVVTSAGIHGTVHRLDEATVTLLLDSAKVTFERSAIARVLRDDPAKTA